MGKQTPAERLFTLTCCLVAAQSYGVSKRQLLESVSGYAENKTQEARDRMFERDKDLLRAMGIQLEVIDGEGSDDPEATRYRLTKQAFDWPKDFTLNERHMQLLELAAKAWNHQSLGQVAQSALTRMRAFGAAFEQQSLQVVSPRLFAKDPNFTPIAEAIDRGVQIEVQYQKPESTPELKHLSPVRLRFKAGQWLLLASDSGELKNYLLRRMVSKAALSELAAERFDAVDIEAAELSLEAHIQSQQATLELRPGSEAWYHFGGDRVQVAYMDQELFAEELIDLGMDVKILEPKSLSEYVTKQLQAVIESHA
ncbi:WYL domain-containing protein [Aquiluna sp. KACHI24]|uniref:helix-turn-helix transcriptional regulator n=1 Tax=Aquiluna sp. KACHI24 TaxID=2968831 RepID=UPI00220968DA|nr:WYL domain-containing protein [Aquiluna sp. KACHI24]BDQ00222.1 WYL domain-containing protein [Aquiluna sp. KACHI24]